MNEHSTEILPNLLREEAFPTARKGYDKHQVDDFVVRNHNQIRDLQERLARAHDELEQLRRQLAEAKAKAVVKPEHEQISERLANILRIADEEASDKRSKVDKEVGDIRASAQEESQAKVKDAQEHAERIVGSARDQANELVTSAKQEAEQLREQAKEESERKLADSEARATRIHETADRRLATLTATHGEAARRLSDMRDTLTELLQAETKAGPLDNGLSRADFGTETADGDEAKDAKDAKDAKEAKPQQPKAEGAKPSAPSAPPAPTAPAAVKDEAAAKNEQPAPQRPAPAKPQPAQNAPARPAPADADEATIKLNPDDEATARISPEDTKAAAEQSGPSSQPVRQNPQRPQGFRYSGPAPTPTEEPTAQMPPINDPGMTGIYRHPEAKPSPDDEATEGVRIIRP
ncbi:hypothetical protein [Nocardiopsis ansamitocini]|uniref:Cell division protein DivIVA n=1 Tax=Nocardiopsis ansamitocini TaxID=1670832 RepID=A0A9W6P593_9ACTN|nr:hypothetical protein [Nocardiopsis ansamitocini]GLU47316.1 hypothetical protein Nans01_16670 [Nocardiopsis ansamitocini]